MGPTGRNPLRALSRPTLSASAAGESESLDAPPSAQARAIRVRRRPRATCAPATRYARVGRIPRPVRRFGRCRAKAQQAPRCAGPRPARSVPEKWFPH